MKSIGRAFALALGVVLGTLALPESAAACAVCFQAKTDATRVAFIASTAAMTFLPLLVVGGGAWWVRRKFAQADARALRGESFGFASAERVPPGVAPRV